MKKSSENDASIDPFAMLGKLPFNPLNDTQLKAWSDLGGEVIKFASSRIQQDLEAQKAILACKSPQDLFKVQTEYFNKAVGDYRAQIQRAIDVMASAATAPVGGVPKSTKRGFDDVPL